MIAQARDWLPDDALTASRIGTALAALLDGWSRHWFAAALPVTLGEAPASPGAQGEGALSFETGSVQLLLSASGKRHLLEAMLGDSLVGKSLTLQDHHLLEKLVACASQDLVDRLAELPAIASASSGPTRKLSLALGGEQWGRLSIPSSALAALIKKSLPLSSAPREPVHNRRHALGPSSVAIDAVLGQVSLSVDDMHGLEPGDILVLNRALEAPLPVRLGTNGALIGQGKFITVEGRNAVAWQE